MMSLTKKIAYNAFVQIAGKAVSVGLSLIVVGLLTRYLGQTGYGYYTTIFAFLQVFGILVDLGLQMTTAQLISDPNVSEAKIFGNIFGLRLATAIIFTALAPTVGLLFPYPNIVKAGLFLMSLTFLFSALSSIFVSVFQKYLAMGKVMAAEMAYKALLLTLTFLAVYYKLNFYAILTAAIIPSAVYFYLLFIFANKYFKIKIYFQLYEWKKIFIKSWPIALTIALNLVYFKADTIILAIFRTPAEVGIYGAPYRVLEVLINFSYLFLGLLLPQLAKNFLTKNFVQFKNLLQQGFDALIIITVPMIFGTYFTGVKIMEIVAGAEFSVSGEILKILILATGAIFIAALFGYAVVAIEKQKEMIKFYFINAVLSLMAYFIFIPIYGYWAGAWLTVISEGFILLTAYWVVYKNIKFRPKLNIFFKALTSSLVMAAVLHYLAVDNLLAIIALGAAVYLGMMGMIRGINHKLILELIKIK